MCHVILGIPVIGLGLFAILPFQLALPTYLVLFAISAVIWWKVSQAMHIPVQSGFEAMDGKSVRVRSWNGREGRVLYRGELWTARTRDPDPPRPGATVRIVDTEGLRVWVSATDDA